LGGTSV